VKEKIMGEVINTTREGAIATVTIDRAAEGNMLDLDMLRALAGAFRDAGASDAKVIALRAAGNDFCRGRDPRGGKASPTALDLRADMIGPIMDVYAAIAGAPQPVVCAVQGAALGFGCALATACDITIATDDSRFSLPELEKNFPPTLAISAMMARVPRKALTWMVYSTGEIDARTALQLGIVSSVVAKSALEAETGKLMAGLATRSREVLIGVKDYMRAAPSMDPRGAADYASNLLAAVMSSTPR
jgi:enoyl-CoA hydratase